jgi:hypothetical protein
MRGMDVIPLIQEALFSIDTERFNEMYRQLLEENLNYGGNEQGFMFKGKFWSHLESKQQARAQKTYLAKELWDRGNAMTDLAEFMTASRQRTQQWLTNLLRGAKDLQEARNLLPDSVTMILPLFADIPRTKPVGYHIKDKPLSQHTYQELSDLIGSYAANKLIY